MNRIKKFLLNNIANLPLPNRLLCYMNRFPSLIYGKKYWRLYNTLTKNKEYDNVNDLINIVNYSVKHVPFYQNNRKINSVEEFEAFFDFIDKKEVNKHFEDFISQNIDLENYEIITTGGTGGKPLKMWSPKNRYIIELATMHSLWNRVGFNHNIRAVIRNKRLEKSKDYEINPITKEIIFDGFRLNDQYCEIIYSIIKKYNIKYIHAYPSSAYFFSKYLVDNNLDTSFIESFLSGSENIYPYQKEFIEKETSIKFYNWYGHSEKLVLAGYCKNSDIYHIEPHYGYFELIDPKGKVIKEKGKVGEIVGTTLNNYGMPLIRYRTDDYAEYVGDFCPKCNKKVTLIKNIQGRWSGRKIYGGDGSIVTTTSLNLHDDLHEFTSGIQFIQNEKGTLKVLIVKAKGFNDTHHRELTNHFKSKFSLNTKIIIVYVDKLQKLHNGKFVDLISYIS